MKKIKTAECVTPKHPDKMCDRISDAILDAYLELDPNSRVAVEVMGSKGLIVVAGEVTSEFTLSGQEISDIIEKIYNTEKRISFEDAETGNFPRLEIKINISEQSPEIAQGVDTGGAGDQGIMLGYACRDNEEMVPQEYFLARSLCKFIYEKYSYDGKTQITLEDGKIKSIVASFQNVKKEVLKELITDWYASLEITVFIPFDIFVNPAGDWAQGGFDADTGLTGRKLAVDNYGPSIALGGGAFSGKDYTKVDRSGAYMARRIAVDILKSKKTIVEVLVKLAYSIGIAEPVMATAEITYFNGDKAIQNITGYDLTPAGIVKALDLKKPIYSKTAEFGHFGNSFNWDK